MSAFAALTLLAGITVQDPENPATALWNALRSGQVAEALTLLEEHPSLATSPMLPESGSKQDDPLVYAAIYGYGEVTTRLLGLGASPEGLRGEGEPLMRAAANGQEAVAELLLDAGARPHYVGRRWPYSAMMAAAERGHGGIVERLLAAGAEARTEALRMALLRGHGSIAARLFAAGADPADEDLLRVAAYADDLPLLQMFFASGKLVGTEEEPLHAARVVFTEAARHDRREVFEWILERGQRDGTIEQLELDLALDFAAAGGQLHLVARLLFVGADPRARTAPRPNLEPRTAMQAALHEKHVEVATMLAQSGAPLDAHSAAALGRTEWLRTHLPEEEEPAGLGWKRWTPLHMAVIGGNRETVAWLLEAGADVNARAASGDTALHLATHDAQGLDIARLLIEAGADVNAQLEALYVEGHWTPRHYAVAFGDHDMVALLDAHGAEDIEVPLSSKARTRQRDGGRWIRGEED